MEGGLERRSAPAEPEVLPRSEGLIIRGTERTGMAPTREEDARAAASHISGARVEATIGLGRCAVARRCGSEQRCRGKNAGERISEFNFF